MSIKAIPADATATITDHTDTIADTLFVRASYGELVGESDHEPRQTANRASMVKQAVLRLRDLVKPESGA